MAYVPIIPVRGTDTSTIKIVNKTIVHSDTVLNVKDLGENIKVTEVTNISKDDLKSFLNKIFENNKDVLFNTIQYSEDKKKVWIYANEKINVDCWKNRNLKTYTYVDPNNLIGYLSALINDSKNGLITVQDDSNGKMMIPISQSSKYVSIDVINKIQMKKTKEMKDSRNKIESQFKAKFKSIENKYVSLPWFIEEFKYQDNTLKIRFNPQNDNKRYDITFGKKDDDLYIVSSNYYDDESILLNYSDIFSKLFDLYVQNESYHSENVSWDYIYGTKFHLYTHSNGFKIFFIDEKRLEKSGYDYKYKYSGFNSSKEISFMHDNIDEIVKNLYFEVDKLPSYMKEEIEKKIKLELERKKIMEEQKKVEERYLEKQRLLEEKRKLEIEKVKEKERLLKEEEMLLKEEKKAKRKALFRKFNIFKGHD